MRYQRDGHGVETLIDRGVPYESLPDWYKDCPALESFDHFYRIAFWRLSTERAIGFSMGAIPHSKIVEYGSRMGLHPPTMDLFEAVIRAMDEAYISWAQQQQTRARKANQQPGVPNANPITKMPKPRRD